MDETLALGLIGAVALVATLAGLVASRAMVKVGSDRALIVRSPRHTRVTFAPAFVMPIVAHAELVDLSDKTIELQRRGREGFSDREGIRVEIDARLSVAPRRTADDVLAIATRHGAATTFDAGAVRRIFEPKLIEALAATIVAHHADTLYAERERVADHVCRCLDGAFEGWTIVDLTLSRIEQAPIDSHDPGDIRDARGIRMITERTVRDRREKLEMERDLRVHEARLRADAETTIAHIVAARNA